MKREETHIGHGKADIKNCAVCDCIEILHILGSADDDPPPPWETEASRHEEAVACIRFILAAYNWRPKNQRPENWRIGCL